MADEKKPDKHEATVIKPKTGAGPVEKTRIKQTTPEVDIDLSNNQPTQDTPGGTRIRPPQQAQSGYINTKQTQALTQIDKVLRAKQDNSGSFNRARSEANKALSTNKILLNNRFVLERIVGTGGMGTVYRAKDLRKVEANDLNPYIAIKVLNESFQDHPDAFITLQREASKSNILSHPNIVSVHDFDRDGRICYLTMELLEGEDLDKYIKRQNFATQKISEAIQIITEYCSALMYAHGKGIIHSDLKPGNLYITEHGTKVLDFGIARLASDTLIQDNFDAGSLGALTPAYASLEMLRNEQPDQSDDVYAAAVIAYELFTGEHPYNRLPADQALIENIKPARIKALSKRQWSALESALKLRRKERTQTIEEFIHGLTHVRKHLILKTMIPMLLVTAGLFVYYEYFNKPDISKTVDSTMQEGHDCFAKGDFICSQNKANAALELDPGHDAAKDLLAKSKESQLKKRELELYTQAKDCLQKDDFDCAKLKKIELMELLTSSQYLPELEKAIPLKQFKVKTERCFASQDLICARDNASAMLELEPDNVYASTIKNQVEKQLSAQDKVDKEKNKQFLSHMRKAYSCMDTKDYNCAVKESLNAKRLKQNDTEAAKLYTRATTLLEQTQQAKIIAIRAANKSIKKGEECLAKLKYDCAITEADHALELNPESQKAQKLKASAIKEREKAKQFTIQ